jgi:hypothetical protein
MRRALGRYFSRIQIRGDGDVVVFGFSAIPRPAENSLLHLGDTIAALYYCAFHDNNLYQTRPDHPMIKQLAAAKSTHDAPIHPRPSCGDFLHLLVQHA